MAISSPQMAISHLSAAQSLRHLELPRNGEPGARSQQPDARSQQSGARSQQPGRCAISAARCAISAARCAISAARCAILAAKCTSCWRENLVVTRSSSLFRSSLFQSSAPSRQLRIAQPSMREARGAAAGEEQREGSSAKAAVSAASATARRQPGLCSSGAAALGQQSEAAERLLRAGARLA